jgi:hypothetical protein
MYQIGLFYYLSTASATQYVDFGLYECALILKKSVSIKDRIYTGIRGRTYNDTWGSRKTAANLIETPVDIIEHCARLQNWSEISDNKKYGKEYSPNALIKTSGAGSYDDSTLDAVGGTDVSLWRPKDLACAGQIMQGNDGYTDDLMRHFARLSWCALRQDFDGYECIHYMPDTTAPTEAITLTKIVGKIGNIIEPQTSDIFCCPYIRYNYNYGSGKYDGLIQILNTNDPNSTGYLTTYTPGATDTGNLEAGKVDGRVIWEQCAWLFSKYKQIETPPSELTDLPFVREYTTALWYLYQWVMWQGKRAITLDVPYSVGKTYYCGMRATLSLPHQTNSKALNCMVTGVRRDKANGIVGLTMLLLQEPTSAAIYQDSDAGSLPKYQDTDAGGVTKWQNYDT